MTRKIPKISDLALVHGFAARKTKLAIGEPMQTLLNLNLAFVTNFPLESDLIFVFSGKYPAELYFLIKFVVGNKNNNGFEVYADVHAVVDQIPIWPP